MCNITFEETIIFVWLLYSFGSQIKKSSDHFLKKEEKIIIIFDSEIT